MAVVGGGISGITAGVELRTEDSPSPCRPPQESYRANPPDMPFRPTSIMVHAVPAWNGSPARNLMGR